jgi:hypothetical protein
MRKMVIEKLHYPLQGITLNGKSYNLNLKEVESFMQQCGSFMATEQHDFETITQIISDQLIDHANPNTPVEELRTQLKFLREITFLLKGIVTASEQEY